MLSKNTSGIQPPGRLHGNSAIKSTPIIVVGGKEEALSAFHHRLEKVNYYFTSELMSDTV